MGRDWRAAEDAVAVARLKAAGAVVLGKTNLAIGLADWQRLQPRLQYDQQPLGRLRVRPWRLVRRVGALRWPRAMPLAVGLGYQRLNPGSCAFLRRLLATSRRRTSCRNAANAPPRSLPLQTDLTSGLGVCGPMARTAADLALALDILAGPDENQAGRVSAVVTGGHRHADLRSYRVLVIDGHPLLPVASDIRAALRSTCGPSHLQRVRRWPDRARCFPILPSRHGCTPSSCATL